MRYIVIVLFLILFAAPVLADVKLGGIDVSWSTERMFQEFEERGTPCRNIADPALDGISIATYYKCGDVEFFFEIWNGFRNITFPCEFIGYCGRPIHLVAPLVIERLEIAPGGFHPYDVPNDYPMIVTYGDDITDLDTHKLMQIDADSIYHSIKADLPSLHIE